MIVVGTAGFSYDDWHGPFYPQDLRPPDRLAYYARHFPAVEVDYTYYRMPTARTMAGMERKTPGGFRFLVKTYRGLTHEVTPDEVTTLFRQYREALAPLVDAGKLGCVLAQFPWKFKNEPASRDYLLTLREGLADLNLVVEFRNASWVEPGVLELLRREGLGFCCVDEPRLRGLMPRVALATTDLGYVRFHGRNAARWWKHDHAWERYDYLYGREELGEWLPKLRDLDSKVAITYAIFNNCHAGQAAVNARDLQGLLFEASS
ncbi:MAG: DUF72 domain-containing protein [bacterium]|nr:DUF72 domain-containing protein [bacterium]